MPTRILLSPSEVSLAKKLKDDAIVSELPEFKGADILLYTKQGLLGIQRKQAPHDFISSFTDGRMARLLPLLTQNCKFTRIIQEGRFRYWPDGTLNMGVTMEGKRVPTRFTRKQVLGMRFDIEFVYGVIVDYTEDIEETVDYIRSVEKYLSGGKHLGLYTRPSAKGNWGVPSARDTDLWLLQSFQGIGPAIAGKIIDHFGGKIPLKWDCTLEQLASVPGLSVKRAKMMMGMLPGGGTSSLDSLRRRIEERQGK